VFVSHISAWCVGIKFYEGWKDAGWNLWIDVEMCLEMQQLAEHKFGNGSILMKRDEFALKVMHALDTLQQLGNSGACFSVKW